jgi:hypothetical protein
VAPQKRLCSRSYSLDVRGSLSAAPQAELFTSESTLHTAYRAARHDSRCVFTRRTSSSKDAPGASKTPTVQPFEFCYKGSHTAPPLTEPGQRILGASQRLPSRAAWFEIALYQTHLVCRGRLWRLKNADVRTTLVLVQGECDLVRPQAS